MMRIFDTHYTQKSAAKKLNVSRNTIVADERNIRNESFNWMESMSSGDFVPIMKDWFGTQTQHIALFNSKLSDLFSTTPADHVTLMKIISPLLEKLEKKDKNTVQKILNSYGNEQKAASFAGAASLYANTTTNSMRFCESLIAMYPLIRTTRRYSDYLDSLGEIGQYKDYTPPDDSIKFMVNLDNKNNENKNTKRNKTSNSSNNVKENRVEDRESGSSET